MAWDDIHDLIEDLNPFHDIEEGWDATEAEVIEVAHAIGFFEGLMTALTDPGMWISLGWLTLGIVLMIIGLRMWIGKPVLPSAPPVIPIPV